MAEQATVARPYARAAFAHASAGSALAAWSEILGRAGAVVADPQVAPLIGNPHVKSADLVTMILEIAGAADDERARNFVRLLADNRRLALLPEIAAQYEMMRADVENTVDATVTSAQALTPEQSQKLSAALSQRLNRTVRLHQVVDPRLIGGAIVRAGDFVVDGSLRGRVERLASAMSGQ